MSITHSNIWREMKESFLNEFGFVLPAEDKQRKSIEFFCDPSRNPDKRGVTLDGAPFFWPQRFYLMWLHFIENERYRSYGGPTLERFLKPGTLIEVASRVYVGKKKREGHRPDGSSMYRCEKCERVMGALYTIDEMMRLDEYPAVWPDPCDQCTSVNDPDRLHPRPECSGRMMQVPFPGAQAVSTAGDTLNVGLQEDINYFEES